MGLTKVSDGMLKEKYVKKSGDTMSGALNMSNHLINNLTDGASAQDAVNKRQLDAVKVTTAITEPSVLEDIGSAANATQSTINNKIDDKLATMIKSNSATLPATVGWYRIATSVLGIQRNSAMFEISWSASGVHGSTTIVAGNMYGNTEGTSLDQIHYATFNPAGQNVTKVRIVSHVTYAENYAFLEVYSTATTAVTLSSKMSNPLGWSLITPITGGIPSGYTSKELTLGVGIRSSSGFDANHNTIRSLANGVNSADAVNKSQLDVKLDKSGGVMTGNLDMNNCNIVGANSYTVVDPGPKKGYLFSGGNGWAIAESPDDMSHAEGNLQFGNTGTTDMSGTVVRKATLRTDGTFQAINGFDANSKTIRSVANGVNATDAVNKGQLDAVKATAIPAGTSFEWNSNTVPTGFLWENGQAISRTTYAELFSIIGTSFGAGDGSTTFNLPNSEGYVSVTYKSSDTSFDTLGEKGGSKTHTLTTTEMPSHTHTQDSHAHSQASHTHQVGYDNDGTGGEGDNFGTVHKQGYSGAQASASTSSSAPTINGFTAKNQTTGGSGAHNNLQPYIVKRKIIKY